METEVAWAIVGILLALAVFDLLVHAVSALIALPVFERKLPFNVAPASPVANAEPLDIPTSDGLTLRGSLHRQKDRAAEGLVIFCPELGGNHWSALTYCAGLWDAGFNILAFDFRNQGESDYMPDYDPLHWLTDFEVEDVMAVIRFAESRDDLRDLPLGIFGISRGGGAALAAAGRSPNVRCVACEGAFSTHSLFLHYTLRWASLYVPGWILRLVPVWHLRLTLVLACRLSQFRRRCRYAHLERLLPKLRHTPVLMIAGGRDTYVLPEITEELCRRIGPGCRGVWVVPRAKHNMARQVDALEYDRRLVEFFSQAVQAPHVERPSASRA